MARPELVATCWTTAGDTSPMESGISPLPLEDRVAAAAAAGFTGFGVVAADLEAYLAGHALADLRTLLEQHGIRHVELELIVDWWVPDGPRRQESDRVARLLRDAAETLGARDVKLGPSTTGDVYDLGQYAEAFRRVSADFAQVGTSVALEFLPWSNIPTLADAVELVTAADHPNGGLLVDLWHVMRGPAGQLDELADVPVGLVKGVEINDADREQVGDAFTDTVRRRRLPGEGDWPVARFIRVLQDIGYAGPWGVEILSDDHRVRPLAESLPDVVAATLAQFDAAEDLDAQA